MGPGSVLRDIMESGVVPVVDLRKIFRQVGLVETSDLLSSWRCMGLR